jgi:hypothetical protein
MSCKICSRNPRAKNSVLCPACQARAAAAADKWRNDMKLSIPPTPPVDM